MRWPAASKKLSDIQAFSPFQELSKMSSTAGSWRTPSPTSSTGSTRQFESFKMRPKPVNTYKKNKTLGGNLWGPVKGWLPFYRCTACRQVMSRKEPAKFPQKIYNCGHVVCAGCIARSYLIELNPLCPCKGCDKNVNPAERAKAAEPAAPVTPRPEEEDAGCGWCHDSPCRCDMRDDCCPSCGSDGRCYCYEPAEWVHYCGMADCDGDCGTLSCGCIDVCRNRCGTRDYY